MSMFHELQELVLFKIWDISYQPYVKSPFIAWEVGKFKPSETSDVVVRKAIDALIERGLLDQIDSATKEFEISAKGIEYVEAQLQFDDSIIGRFAATGDADTFPESLKESKFIPAADRIVTINHNTPEYRSVIEKLEDLKAAIESNNEYRSKNLDDHERRLVDIETTLKILENTRVRIGAIKAAAYGTLFYLAEKFSDEPIGALAHAAWEALKTLLGIG